MAHHHHGADSRSDRAHRRRVGAASCATLVALLATTGCVATVALDRAVVAYDSEIAENISKQLLLNIARSRHNQPMHFTAISSIAATYSFSVSGGVGGAATGDSGGLLVPVLGGSAEENPTFSIEPMQGEEFTQRLLTPFEEQKLTLLLRQGYDVDALLRLMGAELRLQDGAGRVTVHHNRPNDRDGYATFRRVVAHLSSIQDEHALNVEPLHFERIWEVPGSAITPESFVSTYHEFSLTREADGASYLVSKRVNGRVMISNYDPSALTNDERVRLHAEAEEAPPNDILLDIRPGYPGGEYSLHGRLRLRSFHEILNFIGRSIEEEPEFAVTPDPRTAVINDNPVHALGIAETRHAPDGGTLSVRWAGLHYSLAPDSGYQWNRKAFSLLYQLFQMSVSAAGDRGPEITIAK